MSVLTDKCHARKVARLSARQKQTGPVLQPQFRQVDLIRSLSEESFYDFVRAFWKTIIAEKPVWNFHLEYIANQMQVLAERVFRGEELVNDLIINVPPSSTKSTICTIMFPAWVWTRMPSARMICVSYAEDLATDLSRKCRDVVKSELYMECFPDVRIRSDQDGKTHFVNTKGGERFSVGVDGGVTGHHAHFIIVDDPINPKKAVSDVTLKIANDFMGETLSSRKVDERITPTIIVMQRLHEDDPAGNRLANQKAGPVKHICLPAELPPLRDNNVFPIHLRDKYVDGLLDPVRLPRKTLVRKLANLGPYGYAGQFEQRPVPRGEGIFDVERIHLVDPWMVPDDFVRAVRGWDKAGTAGGTGAESAGVKMAKRINGQIWVLDCIAGRWGSADREKMIQQKTILDGIGCEQAVEQEPGSGGKESAENTVRGLQGYRVAIVKVGKAEGDKVARADPFSCQVNGGNVWCVKAPWTDAYLKQLRMFPRGKLKDKVDASSTAFNRLSLKQIEVGGLT